MTIFNNIVLATADTLPVIATTPIFRLANQYLNIGFNNNNLSKNIINLFRAKGCIVASLSAHQEAGRDNPNILGFQKSLSNAIFFCQSKIKNLFKEALHSMAGLFRELERVAVPRFGIVTPFQSCRLCRDKRKQRVKSSLSRTTAMKTNPGTTPQIPQNQLEEFKDAAIALCGGTAFLFLPIPSPTALTQIIAKCSFLIS